MSSILLKDQKVLVCELIRVKRHVGDIPVCGVDQTVL